MRHRVALFLCMACEQGSPSRVDVKGLADNGPLSLSQVEWAQMFGLWVLPAEAVKDLKFLTEPRNSHPADFDDVVKTMRAALHPPLRTATRPSADPLPAGHSPPQQPRMPSTGEVTTPSPPTRNGVAPANAGRATPNQEGAGRQQHIDEMGLRVCPLVTSGDASAHADGTAASIRPTTSSPLTEQPPRPASTDQPLASTHATRSPSPPRHRSTPKTTCLGGESSEDEYELADRARDAARKRKRANRGNGGAQQRSPTPEFYLDPPEDDSDARDDGADNPEGLTEDAAGRVTATLPPATTLAGSGALAAALPSVQDLTTQDLTTGASAADQKSEAELEAKRKVQDRAARRAAANAKASDKRPGQDSEDPSGLGVATKKKMSKAQQAKAAAGKDPHKAAKSDGNPDLGK